MELKANASIAVIGGGPAGALAAYFLLEMADRIGLPIQVDVYEPRDFSKFGPVGCNMCAGVISELLVQTLAAEGINLPPLVVQRGIESYILHTSDLPEVSIHTPSEDLRIATVFRGGGPKKTLVGSDWASFDGYLLSMAVQRGARVIPKRVVHLDYDEDRHPNIHLKEGQPLRYDLVLGASGVNSTLVKTYQEMGVRFHPPKTCKGYVAELYLGEENTQKYLGTSMHIFLLDIPGVKFAALIPKTSFVTVVIHGDNIDSALVDRFMAAPEVRACFPDDMVICKDGTLCELGEACHCLPKLTLGVAQHPYADRLVMLGDLAVSRLYKDGIGAAYITAKAAAVTAIFQGVSAHAFATGYLPVIQRIGLDNEIGQTIFFITTFYKRWKFMRRGMVGMVKAEEGLPPEDRRMSRVLWDTFTGSATYREIFWRAMHPIFFWRLGKATLSGFLRGV